MATDLATLQKWVHQSGELVESKSDPADAWECQVEGIRVLIVASEEHDRMRIMTRVADAQSMNPALMQTMLEANFDRALDAKYTISHNAVWSLFVHPLSSLTEAMFENALRQVLRLVLNYGTTFASGQDRFETR